MTEKRIVVNQIRTPDGTVLVSRHRHDYVEYTDKNGFTYMVDGGQDYLRRNVHEEAPYEELTVYDDSPFELVREHYCRGGRGKDGTEPLTWVPIARMSDAWLRACILYNEERGLANSLANEMYKKELNYRAQNSIFIED